MHQWIRSGLGERVRTGVVAVVIAVGVFASIATQEYGPVTKVSPQFRTVLNETNPSHEQSVRFCPAWGYATHANDPTPTIVEFDAELEQTAGGDLPISLSFAQSIAHEQLNNEREELSVALEVERVDGDNAECSPWLDLAFGPINENDAGVVVLWSVSFTADVDTNAPDRGRLEFRP